MAKKNDLKNSMSAGLTGGLDSLIQSTAGQKEAQKPKKAKTVHCNFVMDETYHQNLKLIAIRKGDSLKSVLQEAISDYLDKNSSLLYQSIGNIQGKHSTKEILQEKGTQKAPLHIKKYIENAIPYKKPVGRVNLAYV